MRRTPSPAFRAEITTYRPVKDFGGYLLLYFLCRIAVANGIDNTSPRGTSHTKMGQSPIAFGSGSWTFSVTTTVTAATAYAKTRKKIPVPYTRSKHYSSYAQQGRPPASPFLLMCIIKLHFQMNQCCLVPKSVTYTKK